MRSILILILSHLLFNSFSQPNKYRFYSYGQEQGLNSTSINAIAEDTYGFIWIGTENGLFRFDAYQFKEFRKSKNRHSGLITNSITALYALPNGDLLVGTRDGLSYFDNRKEAFINLWTENVPTYIAKIIDGTGDEFWIATRNGLYLLNLKSRDFQRFGVDSALSSNNLFDIIKDSKGRLWISSDNGLNVKLPNQPTFKVYRHDEADERSISSNRLRKLGETADGRILVGTSTEGLSILNPSTGQFKRYNHDPNDPFSLSTRSAYSILVDSRENIWVGTWANGLNLFDIESERFLRYTNNQNDIYSVPDNSIKCLMESTSGDIWLGTEDAGVARLSPSIEKIIRYQHDSRNDNSLRTNNVKSVYEDNEGSLWIGTGQNGLHKYLPGDNKFEVYLPTDKSRRSEARGTVWSISEGADGDLWLGTGIGLARFNRFTKESFFYEPDENNENSISTNDILEVLYDTDGYVWTGSWRGGLNRLDLTTGKFYTFYHDTNDSTTIAGNTISRIHKDQKGNLWVEAGGVLHLMNKDQTFRRFDLPVSGLAEASNGNLWIISDEGLFEFDTQELIARPVMDPARELERAFFAIEIDDKQRIWLGSKSGVICYQPGSNKVVGHFQKSDGLAGNNIYTFASDYGQKLKKLYFGGIEGLSAIDTDLLSASQDSTKVVLTDFLVFNQPVVISDSTQLAEAVHAIEEIKLNYNDYIFAFGFASLDYAKPKDVQYAYRLEGFDSDWIYTDYLDRKAVYTNVPPGHYTFQVKSTNRNKEWQDNSILGVKVIIIPPWWQTLWAKIIFTLISIIALFSVFRIRLAFLTKQKKRLEIQVKERSAEVLQQKEVLEVQAAELRKTNEQKNKLFSIIAHDLKTPLNTLENLVPLIDPEILNAENLAKIKESLSEKIEAVSGAMGNLLIWAKSQLEGEIIQKHEFALDEMIPQKVRLFKPYADSKRIKLVGNSSTDLVVYADENQVRAIFRNLISNALKFTDAGGTVHISAEEVNGMAEVTIKDSGLGIPEDKIDHLFEVKSSASLGTSGEQGVGLGLIVVKDFVEKNDGEIKVQSALNIGTTFTFTLPLHK